MSDKIKNGDMPAIPLPLANNGSPLMASDLGNGYAEKFRPAFGVTKREQFAAMAMQGILSNRYYSDFCGGEPGSDKGCWLVAVRALKHADALLKELEK